MESYKLEGERPMMKSMKFFNHMDVKIGSV
jgi:hypothetical protein